MMGFIDLIFDNIVFLIAILAGIMSLFKKSGDNEDAGPVRSERPKPVTYEKSDSKPAKLVSIPFLHPVQMKMMKFKLIKPINGMSNYRNQEREENKAKQIKTLIKLNKALFTIRIGKQLKMYRYVEI